MGCGWRACFILALLLVVGVPLASLVAGVVNPRHGWCGLPFVAVAVFSLLYNWGLEVRWRFHLRKCGSREGFQYTSGIPVVGNLFAVLGATFGWGDWWATMPAVLTVALDPCGLPWFVVAMIRTRQF
jgi:hypothetical protein